MSGNKRRPIMVGGVLTSQPDTVDTRPRWVVTHEATERTMRAINVRRAVGRAAHIIHRTASPTYPYTITVQRKSGGPITTVEITTAPQEPVFRLRVLG